MTTNTSDLVNRLRDTNGSWEQTDLAAREAADMIEFLSSQYDRLAAQFEEMDSIARRAIEFGETAQPAMRFAGMVLKAHRNDGYPGDVDGADLQEFAIACGLGERRTVAQPCGETCSCLEFAGSDGFPVECYFNTEAGNAAIAQSKEADEQR